MPEGDATRFSGRRRHHHLGRRDIGDPPGGRPQDKGFTGAHLVDHLFVQLADPLAVVQQIHREQTAVRNGPPAHDRQPLRAGAATDFSFQTIPDDAGAQLGEFIGGIATAEHVERRFQGAGAEITERVRPMHQF